ncbi:MAG TPA: hypothetical protein PK359_07190 [Burkholderiaceae bacterium]|jgi:flagellar motility protein MotE (MotC chaperone)|nr:hypothetical protein [Burkholderiaceae bacterium]
MVEISAVSAVSGISAIRPLEPAGQRDHALTATLEATWRRLQKELSDLRAAQAAPTPKTRADLDSLTSRIAAIEERLARQAHLAHLHSKPG